MAGKKFDVIINNIMKLMGNKDVLKLNDGKETDELRTKNFTDIYNFVVMKHKIIELEDEVYENLKKRELDAVTFLIEELCEKTFELEEQAENKSNMKTEQSGENNKNNNRSKSKDKKQDKVIEEIKSN